MSGRAPGSDMSFAILNVILKIIHKRRLMRNATKISQRIVRKVQAFVIDVMSILSF